MQENLIDDNGKNQEFDDLVLLMAKTEQDQRACQSPNTESEAILRISEAKLGVLETKPQQLELSLVGVVYIQKHNRPEGPASSPTRNKGLS